MTVTEATSVLRFEVLLPQEQMREGEVEAQTKMHRGVDLGVSATRQVKTAIAKK